MPGTGGTALPPAVLRGGGAGSGAAATWKVSDGGGSGCAVSEPNRSSYGISTAGSCCSGGVGAAGGGACVGTGDAAGGLGDSGGGGGRADIDSFGWKVVVPDHLLGLGTHAHQRSECHSASSDGTAPCP